MKVKKMTNIMNYLPTCLYRWPVKANAIYLRVHQTNRTIQAHIIPRKKRCNFDFPVSEKHKSPE